MVKKLLERFLKKNCKKTNQTKFTVVKGKKAINYIWSGRAMIVIIIIIIKSGSIQYNGSSPYDI